MISLKFSDIVVDDVLRCIRSQQKLLYVNKVLSISKHPKQNICRLLMNNRISSRYFTGNFCTHDAMQQGYYLVSKNNKISKIGRCWNKFTYVSTLRKSNHMYSNFHNKNTHNQSPNHTSNNVHATKIKEEDDNNSSQPLYYLAHMNYARLKHPYSHPDMLEFVNALIPVNLLAKTSPGFIWAFDNPILDNNHNDTDTEKWNQLVIKEREMVPLLRDDPMLMPQLSLWTDVQSLRHFAFKSGHAMYYKRKREWFTDDVQAPYAVCWWYRNNQRIFQKHPPSRRQHVCFSSSSSSSSSSYSSTATVSNTTMIYPTLFEAFERCERLRRDGPTAYAFDFASAKTFPMPTD
jgi:Domain of unknown function (DUF3291)